MAISDITAAYRAFELRVRRIRQWALICTGVAAASTTLALLLRSRVLIALTGFLATLVLVASFSLAHLVTVGLDSFERRTGSNAIGYVLGVGAGFATILRAAILSIAQWVVDFYVSLSSGGLHAFVSDAHKDVGLSLAFLAVGFLDSGLEGKNGIIRFLSRSAATYGYFFFLAGISMLSLAMISGGAFHASLLVFAWPPWFLMPDERATVHDALALAGQPTLVSWPAMVPMLLLLLTVIGVSRTSKLRDDVGHFMLALLAFICITLSASLL